jgi:5'-methylthioadenosine phosphorylase
VRGKPSQAVLTRGDRVQRLRVLFDRPQELVGRSERLRVRIEELGRQVEALVRFRLLQEEHIGFLQVEQGVTVTTEPVAVGVFGGSGFYSLLDDVEEVNVDTPYGEPSATFAVGQVEETRVAFLPRHGRKHQLPPHKINYRANLWAMKELGVTRIIGPCAAGSLQRDVKPGDFVISDQLVDRTSGRRDTFYDGPQTTHIAFADPYCPELRSLAIQTGSNEGITIHERGTVVTIQGPRFSTRAESKWFQDAGWEVINMTQYPEAYLARELEICYANVALITDYDVGVEGESEAVTHEAVIEVFNANNARLRDLLFSLIPKIPTERTCPCASALQGARFEP